VDRLPIPNWLLFLLLFLFIGLIQHVVAWSKGMLATGEFNFDLATAGYWLVGGLFLGIYVLKGAAKALDEFRPLLNATEEEYTELKYRFVTIPRGVGTIVFLIGLPLGAMSGISDMAIAPAVDYAFPQMRIGIWMTGAATAFLFFYQIIRQLRQINAFYAMSKQINVFNLRPMFGFTRYTAILGIALFFYQGVVPLALDPTAFASRLVLDTSLAFVPLILLMFFVPIWGVHQHLVNEKDRILQEINSHMATIFERIRSATFEQENYEKIGDMNTVFSILKGQKETIKGLSTWPWQPGTLTGLLSSLLLPIVLTLIRDLILKFLGV